MAGGSPSAVRLTGDDMAAIPGVAQSAAAVHQRIELALRMIEFGGSVFPLVHDGKVPFIRKAAGGEGFRDARPDPDMARTFLSNPSQLNYGVQTRSGGWHAYYRWQSDLYGPLPPATRCWAGRCASPGRATWWDGLGDRRAHL